MMKTLLKILCINFLLHYGQVYAQDESSNMIRNSLSDLAVVGGCAGGGAVLGLSTLSFYAHPSLHYKNILYGAAIGLIAGVSIVAFSTATKAQKGINTPENTEAINNQNFSSLERLAWHYHWDDQRLSSLKVFNSEIANPYFANYSFSF